MKGTEDRGACTRETKGKEKQDREDGERERRELLCDARFRGRKSNGDRRGRQWERRAGVSRLKEEEEGGRRQRCKGGRGKRRRLDDDGSDGRRETEARVACVRLSARVALWTQVAEMNNDIQGLAAPQRRRSPCRPSPSPFPLSPPPLLSRPLFPPFPSLQSHSLSRQAASLSLT